MSVQIYEVVDLRIIRLDWLGNFVSVKICIGQRELRKMFAPGGSRWIIGIG